MTEMARTEMGEMDKNKSKLKKKMVKKVADFLPHPPILCFPHCNLN